MKPLFCLVALVLCINANTQTYKTVEVIKDVEEEQVIKLSSDGLGATFKKISRVCIPVNLPANTVTWSYIFSTTLNDDNTKIFNTAAKLAIKAGVVYTSGPAAAASFNTLINNIPIPTGSSAASIYILDAINQPLFLSRKAFNSIGGSLENQNNGKIVSAYVPGQQFYIGIQNTSSWQRIVYVKIKLYASVRERVLVEEKATNTTVIPNAPTTKPSTAEVVENKPLRETKSINEEKASLYGNMGWKAFGDGDIDKCIELSKKAMAFDTATVWIRTNLGLCYLLKGDESTATDYYVEALVYADKIAKKIIARSYLEDAVTDIDKAQEKKKLTGADIIRSMLQQKINTLK